MDTAEVAHADQPVAGRLPLAERDGRSGIKSVLVAILVHVVIGLLLGLIVVQSPVPWETQTEYYLPANSEVTMAGGPREESISDQPLAGNPVAGSGEGSLNQIMAEKQSQLFPASWPEGLGVVDGRSPEPLMVADWRVAALEQAFGEPKKLPQPPATLGGLSVPTANVGVLLDCSWSMRDKLPAVRAFLEQHFPGQPALELDECGLALDDQGAQNRVLTAARVLVERYQVDAIYWICDLQDERTLRGVESLRFHLNPRGRARPIPLFVTSLDRAPDQRLSRLVMETRGKMECIRQPPSSSP